MQFGNPVGLMTRAGRCPRTIHGLPKTAGFDGFGQVIDGIGFKGAQCVMIEGRDEDDDWGLGAQSFQHVKAASSRHLDVEEQNVRAGFRGLVASLDYIGGFVDAIDPVQFPQQSNQPPAG